MGRITLLGLTLVFLMVFIVSEGVSARSMDGGFRTCGHPDDCDKIGDFGGQFWCVTAGTRCQADNPGGGCGCHVYSRVPKAGQGFWDDWEYEAAPLTKVNKVLGRQYKCFCVK